MAGLPSRPPSQNVQAEPGADPEIEELKARLARSQTERDHLAEQISLATQALSEARNREGALEREAADRQALVAELRAENDNLTRSKTASSAESAARQERIDALAAQLEEARESLEEAAAQASKRHEEAEQRRSRLEAELAQVREELTKAQADCTQLRADLALNHELTAFVALKNAKEELDTRFASMGLDLSRARAALESAQAELASLKQERIELNLKVSSLEDSVSSSKLAHDNEILRGIVERQKLELQGLRPAKKKRG